MSEQPKPTIRLICFKDAEISEHQEKIYRFMDSLRDEKTTFALGYDQLVGAQQLVVATDEEERWLGMAGFRRRGFVAVFFLVVHRDAQNMGLGRRLVAEVLRSFPPYGLMLLSVTRSNLKARRLYDAFGFKTIQRGRQSVVMVLLNPAMKLAKPFLWLALNLRDRLGR